MSESVNRTNEDNVNRGTTADPATIDSLIAALTCDDVPACQRARQSLVAIGGPAVAPLVKALADPNDQVRWGAAKALGQIGDPASASALVNALEDENISVRWLAAEGLIALGREGLAPLLQALAQRPDSVWLRHGVHHVLHDLAGKGLGDLVAPVLAALEDIAPALEVPQVAMNALKALRGAAGRHGDQ